MSGDGKRGDGHRPPATAPIFDSTTLICRTTWSSPESGDSGGPGNPYLRMGRRWDRRSNLMVISKWRRTSVISGPSKELHRQHHDARPRWRKVKSHFFAAPL